MGGAPSTGARLRLIEPPLRERNERAWTDHLNGGCGRFWRSRVPAGQRDGGMSWYNGAHAVCRNEIASELSNPVT